MKEKRKQIDTCVKKSTTFQFVKSEIFSRNVSERTLAIKKNTHTQEKVFCRNQKLGFLNRSSVVRTSLMVTATKSLFRVHAHPEKYILHQYAWFAVSTLLSWQDHSGMQWIRICTPPPLLKEQQQHVESRLNFVDVLFLFNPQLSFFSILDDSHSQVVICFSEILYKNFLHKFSTIYFGSVKKQVIDVRL